MWNISLLKRIVGIQISIFKRKRILLSIFGKNNVTFCKSTRKFTRPRKTRKRPYVSRNVCTLAESINRCFLVHKIYACVY